MLTGLQIQINTLNAIVPGSFIFVLDSIDGTFMYKSSDCHTAIKEILSLDKMKGIDNLIDQSGCFATDTKDHSCMIKKLGPDTFLGFFALKEKFTRSSIENAKENFLKITAHLT